MTGSSRVEPNIAVKVNDMDSIEDPSMTSDGTADNNINDQIGGDNSAASITKSECSETMPDGDSEFFQLFTVGERQNSSHPERKSSGESEKGKNANTRQKRLSLPSKVGHISGNTSKTAENSKLSSSPTLERRSSESGTNRGDKQNSSYPEREGFGESEKGKNANTIQKRLSLSSKVGHISENTSKTAENSKPTSSTTLERRSSESGTNGKASRSARYFWVSIKRKLSRRRGNRETTVKEIHIPPEQGEDKWASRSLQDHNHSTSNSTSSSRAGSSGSRSYTKEKEKTNLKVMQDNELITQHSLHSPHKR